MTRTTWLQERRIETFCDVLGRLDAKRLSALGAAALPGMSERSVRRYRRRREAEGRAESLRRARRLAGRTGRLRGGNGPATGAHG